MPENDGYTGNNYAEGIGAFQTARLRAFWDDFASLLRGKSAELLSFEDVRARLRLREENYRGLQDVPLEQIAGSVGRYREFNARFLPRRGNMQERWSRVYAVATGMMGLPPIELYKVGDVYFVRDGNHRVSVAHQMGASTIQAHVTELPTSVPLRPGMTDEELDAATAYAAFLDETRLSFTRPHHVSLQLTETSRYGDLLGHVYLHRSIMQQAEKREIEIEDAAANWYDNVFRPAVTLIRKYNVMAQEDGRTEADLYLWMVEHIAELKQLFGDETPTHSFADALVDFLVERGMKVPQELLVEKDDTVELARPQLEAELAKIRDQMNAQLADDDPPDNEVNGTR